jgi:single-strand DNA-binding protein
MYMNQLTIIGFTGQDAELHYTQNGTPVTTLSVATKESWKNDQGEWQSRTEWHRVVAFGKLAEYARASPRARTFSSRVRFARANTRRTA